MGVPCAGESCAGIVPVRALNCAGTETELRGGWFAFVSSFQYQSPITNHPSPITDNPLFGRWSGSGVRGPGVGSRILTCFTYLCPTQLRFLGWGLGVGGRGLARQRYLNPRTIIHQPLVLRPYPLTLWHDHCNKDKKRGYGGKEKGEGKGDMGSGIWERGDYSWVLGDGWIVQGRWLMGDGRLFMGDGRVALGDGRWEIVHGRGRHKIITVGTKKVLDNGF